MHNTRILLLAVLLAHLPVGEASAQTTSVIFTDQGADWTPELRAEFYRQDQGSKMIPLAWLRSLKQADGQPFLSDSLARYGYLPNPANTNGLPIGFTAPGPAGTQAVGMTCSACHTRQITAEGKTYQIDGGPAFADFQSFLSDLDAAVGKVVASGAAFAPFASTVLASPSPAPGDVAALRQQVDAWYLRYHALISRALPPHPWGPARLDAVTMIFDRLTGLDLGPPPSLLIEENITVADAPVRYPFLWNAPIQNKTQWSGFAPNGNDLLALVRNLGEVYGVFGVFQPQRQGLFVHYDNSANFAGLDRNEKLVRQIGPPKWPKDWLIDTNLAAQGKTIYERPQDQGGCVDCHGIKVVGFPITNWDTPVQNVGTDTRQFDVLTREAKTGVLQGAWVPPLNPLGATDSATCVLGTSVLGSILEHNWLNLGLGGTAAAAPAAAAAAPLAFPPINFNGRLPPELLGLEGAFRIPSAAAPAAAAAVAPAPAAAAPAPAAAACVPVSKGAYEARVLQGIWAAAPYLHNGSVPTLAELLKPPAERAPKFKIGQAYDTANVGLAVDQAQFNYELETSDCANLNSGNSRCGHAYGTTLPAAEKKALLEYLKTL
jgi:hypothetical protein